MAYEFKEFPKWVKTPEGKDVIVKYAEEEVKITGKKEEKVIEKPNKSKKEW